MVVWPGAREVAASALTAWIFPHLHATGRGERAGALMVDLVAWWAGRDCLFLASALARHATGGGCVARFDRHAPEGEPTLAHAVFVPGLTGPAALGGTGLDILGVRPVPDLAEGLSVLGRLTPAAQGPVEPGEFAEHAERVALAVAGCLPWLRPHVPPAFAVRDRDAFACLDWICRGWGPLRDGDGGADARWVASLPPLPGQMRGAAHCMSA